MKKSIVIWILALCLALLCACGETAESAPETPAPAAQEQTQQIPEESADEQPEPSAPETQTPAEQTQQAPAQEPEEEPAEPSALETALTFVDQDAAALISAIGEPLETAYEASCSGPGDDGVWTYDGFIVFTYRENGVETIVDAE